MAYVVVIIEHEEHGGSLPCWIPETLWTPEADAAATLYETTFADTDASDAEDSDAEETFDAAFEAHDRVLTLAEAFIGHAPAMPATVSRFVNLVV